MKKWILIGLALLGPFELIFAQHQLHKGTDFWLGFQKNILNPELFVVIASGRATNGTIEMPLNNWSQDFSLEANSIQEIAIPISAMAQFSEFPEPRGLHISTSDSVTVLAMNTVGQSSDATLVLPNQRLGTEYRVLSYPKVPGSALSEFLIVATSDNTEVLITPSDTTANDRLPGAMFTANLDAGEVYQVQSTLGNLTGSHIVSDQAIAVFGGHGCAIVPSGAFCDHLFEQLIPVDQWATDFVSMPLQTRLNGDTYLFMAAEDETVVELSNGDAFFLTAGAFVEKIIDGPQHITANKPISVALYSNSQTYDQVSDSDPFMIVLPPTNHLIKKSLFTTFALTPFSTTYYLNVWTLEAQVGTIQLDGQSISPTLFETIPGTPYAYATFEIDPGTHLLEAEGTCQAYTYAYANAEGYGFNLGDILFENLVNTQEVTQAKNWQLYPQPAKDYVVLDLMSEQIQPFSFILYNQQGSIALQLDDISSNLLTIERNGLPVGTYFFQLFDEQQQLFSGQLIFD